MNFPRIINYGNRFFNRIRQTLPAFTAATVPKLDFPPATFFSSLCSNSRTSECSKLFLAPSSPILVSTRGMKVRGHLQLRCKDCYFERKDGILYVMCSSYPRHKQKQLTKREKYTWILTHCFQSKHRPW